MRYVIVQITENTLLHALITHLFSYIFEIIFDYLNSKISVQENNDNLLFPHCKKY